MFKLPSGFSSFFTTAFSYDLSPWDSLAGFGLQVSSDFTLTCSLNLEAWISTQLEMALAWKIFSCALMPFGSVFNQATWVRLSWSLKMVQHMEKLEQEHQNKNRAFWTVILTVTLRSIVGSGVLSLLWGKLLKGLHWQRLRLGLLKPSFSGKEHLQLEIVKIMRWILLYFVWSEALSDKDIKATTITALWVVNTWN